MAKNAPGKHYRKGLTLLDVSKMFDDEAKAYAWLESRRWPNGPHCPDCGSFDVQSGIKHKTMTHRCRDCPGRNMFTLRKGTVMEGTKMSYQTWAVGIYLFTTNIKGISSMKLHRELGIGQKAAWFMLHRLRKAAEAGDHWFRGPVEVDETYFGGKRKNMSNTRRKAMAKLGRGTAGKAVVAGAKDRATNQVRARQIPDTTKPTLQKFVAQSVAPGAKLYTDDAAAYEGMPPYEHSTVNHSANQYVDGDVHTNSIESFWSLMKRGYVGIYHKMSEKHLDRYVREFEGRANIREMDTLDQMGAIVDRMGKKRLKYKDLIRDNGLDSGARPRT